MSKEQNYIVAGHGDMALDAYGNQKVVRPYSLFSSLFTYDIPIKKWLSVVNGVEESLSASTLSTSIDGKLSVKTAAVASDVTTVTSRRHPMYQPNRGHVYSTSVYIPAPNDNAVEDFGLFTDINGVFFRVHTDGNLYACIQSGGVMTHTELIHMPFELDYSKGNIFDIQMQWRGAGGYRFFAGNPKTGKIEVIHTIASLNLNTELTIRNPALPAAYRVTSMGDAGELQSGCADITTEGGEEAHEQYESAKSIAKTVGGTDIPVLAVYSPALVNGRVNTRDARLARITGASDKRAIFQVWTTRDVTAFTGANFISINHGSYIESDIAATAVDTAKLSFISAFRVSADGFQAIENPSREKIDFFFIHGDYIVVTATASAGTCDAVIEWGEET